MAEFDDWPGVYGAVGAPRSYRAYLRASRRRQTRPDAVKNVSDFRAGPSATATIHPDATWSGQSSVRRAGGRADRVGGGARVGRAPLRVPETAPPEPDVQRAAQPAIEAFGLTDRELEVLQLVAAGRSNPQIATELFISPKTASVHVSNIISKLRVSSRGEAAALAHRLGLGAPTPAGS